MGNVIAFKRGTAPNTPPDDSGIAIEHAGRHVPRGRSPSRSGMRKRAGEPDGERDSSNQSVVANSGIVLGGSGASRTVGVTPVANANGTTTITVDGQRRPVDGDDAFVLTVTAVNDLPTISSVANRRRARVRRWARWR